VTPARPADLRTTWLGAAAWLGALVGLHVAAIAVTAVMSGALVVAVVARRHLSVFGCVVTGAGAALAAFVTVQAVASSPVATWAHERPIVEAVLSVRSDPVTKDGPFGAYVVVHARVDSMVVRGRHVTSSVPVVLIGRPSWADVRWGSRVRCTARLTPSDRGDQAGLLYAVGSPATVRSPSRLFDLADGLRASVRRAAVGGPDQASALVPALVTGEDQDMSESLVADFRTAGLTHLTAVSGTNLTLVLAAVMLIAGWCGVRGRARLLMGLVAIAGFVVLARPQPSVLRAAVMGTVALLALGSGASAGRGARALGVAVVALLLLDPWLAVSPGFALSTLATAGILFAAPPMVSALSGWMPRPLAEAVAVPLAAQLSCTPVVAGLSGRVSVVAVLANLVAAPVVGPATVLGLAGGVVGLVVPVAGWLVSRPAVWCAQLIVVDAERSAGLPGAAVDWPATLPWLAVLTVLAVLAALVAPRVLRLRGWSVALMAGMLVVLLVRLPTPGWPPDGWVLVMCDVGQGDALVLNAGNHQAVVVDTGPDPSLVDRCLDRLGVQRIPAVVLTHFHADHVNGLPGVLGSHQVGELDVTALSEPAYGAAQVSREARADGVPVRVPAFGEVDHVGPITWQVVGPRRIVSESPNDASVVLLVESHGVRMLLAGDAEPPSQELMAAEHLGSVDVLKVPHHGSAYQDFALLDSLRPRVALVSVGADNDYGHPAPVTMRALARTGAIVRRTDQDGDIAVVSQDGQLRVVTR
jgi:competence protein ComEC